MEFICSLSAVCSLLIWSQMLYFVQWGVFSTVKSEVIFMELDAVLCAVRYFFLRLILMEFICSLSAVCF